MLLHAALVSMKRHEQIVSATPFTPTPCIDTYYVTGELSLTSLFPICAQPTLDLFHLFERSQLSFFHPSYSSFFTLIRHAASIGYTRARCSPRWYSRRRYYKLCGQYGSHALPISAISKRRLGSV